MCGGTYLQLTQFLIFQTGILMALSIPVGVIAGKLCFPLLNVAFRYMTGYEISMALGGQPVILSSCIIGLRFLVYLCESGVFLPQQHLQPSPRREEDQDAVS